MTEEKKDRAFAVAVITTWCLRIKSVTWTMQSWTPTWIARWTKIIIN